MFARRALMVSLLVMSGSIFCQAAKIDSGVFTTYTTNDAKTMLDFTACGSIPPGNGCYGIGLLGPFGKIGSMVEGSKAYNNAKGKITRHLYIVDQAYGPGQNGVALYDYKRVDTILNGSGDVAFTLVKTVPLPLTGGSAAAVFMGANNDYLVIGTSLTAVPVEIAKSTYVITPLNINSQIPISITADNYGFVTVTSAPGFFVVGPDGTVREFGGGSPFTINTIQGMQP